MVRKLLLPLAAVGCFLFTSYHLARTHQTPPDREPLSRPARSPYADVVAGTRDSRSAYGEHQGGLATAGRGERGGRGRRPAGRRGELLFRLDDRQLRAEMKVREAELAVAAAALSRLGGIAPTRGGACQRSESAAGRSPDDQRGRRGRASRETGQARRRARRRTGTAPANAGGGQGSTSTGPGGG